MGIWTHHHAVTTSALVGPDMGSQLKSWVTAGLLMIPLFVVEDLEWLPHPP